MARLKHVNKRKRNMVKIIFIILGSGMAILLAIVLTIVLTFITLVKHTDKVNDRQKKIVNTYPTEIEKKLEDKYGRKFVVDPKFVLNTSNPIPFADAYAPYEYKVKDEDGYVFWVWVYPKSAKDKRIKEISDNYYWKTIEKETKEYIKNNMKDLLPKEYKIIFLADPLIEFDNIGLSIPMETYLSTLNYQLDITICIVAPPKHESINEKLTRENIYPALNAFYKKNSSNLWIKFIYYYAVSDEDYEKVNVDQLETAVFLDNQENFWDSVNMIKELELEIK